ncbi:MAG: hypothetical protein ABI664_15170 [bacterium]
MLNPQVVIPLAVVLATPVAMFYRWLQHRERLAALRSRSAIDAEADAERLAHLERAVEAIALEVERVGEGQRYLTRVLAERPLPLPVEAPPAA